MFASFFLRKFPKYHDIPVFRYRRISIVATRLNSTTTRFIFSTSMPSNQKYISGSTGGTMPHICKNKLNLDNYGIVGFDLDCTLLRYNLNEMLLLEYQVLKEFLVEKKGYSRALQDKLLDWDFLQKGLVLDIKNGNILKLSADAKIMRGTHGTKLMTDDEIVLLYGTDRKWSVASQFYNDPISTWNGPLSEEIRTVLDYFDIPASLVFAQSVDVVDAEFGQRRQKSYNIWADILDGLICMYGRENFANGQSKYFNALRADPERYLLRTNDKVINWLKDLRSTGKALFLLTGSNVDFANFTATYALGSDWRKLFDCVVCFAKKPGFFISQRPYLRIDIECTKELANNALPIDASLELNNIYSQGNWHQLQQALSAKLGMPSENVRSIYFGDNLIQDIYTPVKHGDLDAVAVCEELQADNGHFAANYEFPQAISSKFWGSYFSLNSTPTLWTSIIEKYAQLCVPTMQEVVEAPASHNKQCDNPCGYYTSTTQALQS